MENPTSPSQSGAKGAFDRRTVLKGAAWSLPVVAVAVAAPAASASGGSPAQVIFKYESNYDTQVAPYITTAPIRDPGGVITDYTDYAYVSAELLFNGSGIVFADITSVVATLSPAGDGTNWVFDEQSGGTVSGDGRTLTLSSTSWYNNGTYASFADIYPKRLGPDPVQQSTTLTLTVYVGTTPYTAATGVIRKSDDFWAGPIGTDTTP